MKYISLFKMVDIMKKYTDKRLAILAESINVNIKALYTVAISLNANIIERDSIYADRKQPVVTNALTCIIDDITNYFINTLDKPLDKPLDKQLNKQLNKQLASIPDDDLEISCSDDDAANTMADIFMKQQNELDDIMLQQNELDALMAEKRKKSLELSDIPKRNINFHLETVPTATVPTIVEERADNINIPQNIPINALTRISPNEREELLYKLFITATENVKKKQITCDVETAVNAEADRLLKLYLETH